MNVNYQIVGFGGRLTKDVEVYKNTVAKFCVAVNTGWGDKQKPVFVNCVSFSKMHGEKTFAFLAGLKKGTNVGVRGDFTTNSYQKDGKTISSLELIVNQFNVYSEKPKEVSNTEGDVKNESVVQDKEVAANEFDDDSIPF